MSILPETDRSAQVDASKAWRDEPCPVCNWTRAELPGPDWASTCTACYDVEAEISTGRVLVAVR